MKESDNEKGQLIIIMNGLCLSSAMEWKNGSSACRKAAGFHL